MDENLQEALLEAKNGGAICFLGAGFSRDIYTENAIAVPDVRALSAAIWEILDDVPSENTPLADLADACEEDPTAKQKLVELLINSFTLCIPSDDQKAFLSLPWRAIFTTNFDDVAERAVGDAQVVTPSTAIGLLNQNKTPIYHLHGRAKDLLEGQGDPSIVLSETSYLKVKESNKDLYAALENEVHTATRIFFIGYSLRDAEIASRLFAIEGLRDRSVVISGPTDKKFTTKRLEKFGYLFPIGLSGAVDAIKKVEELPSEVSSPLRLSFLKRVIPEGVASEVTLDDVHNMILSGGFLYPSYARHKLDIGAENPYCVSREEATKKVFSAIAAGTNRVIVTSDLGNGKTFILNELTFEASSKGYDVVWVEHDLPEAYQEIDRLIQKGGRKFFVVDDLIRRHKIVRYIGKRLPANCALISASGAIHGNSDYYKIVDDLGGPVREVDANQLSTSELEAWDKFLERWGFWGDRIEDERSERIKFLRDRCSAENRAIIVSIFRTSAIANKIRSIVDFFLNRNNDLSKAFISVLINALCRNHVEWSRIVAWLDIDEQKLKKAITSSGVFDFMSGTRQWYNFSSAELADFILANYDFRVEEIVEVYVKIVRETAYSANDPRSGFDSKENLKELMRFRFLTRLFSNPENGSATISAVYHRLSSVPRIRENDQFWLQYAMARMEVGDTMNAETFINTSLGIARSKGLDYSVRQIIDQRCRLLFRKNIGKEKRYSSADISQAIFDLMAALNFSDGIITHPLRASGDIVEFLEDRIDDMPRQDVENLLDCVKLMKKKLPDGRLPKSQKGETRAIRDNISKAFIILSNA